MSKFEVKDIYISDLVLDPNRYSPKRTLNIQVELNYEAQVSFRATNPTPEEVAKELGDTIAQSFLDTPHVWGGNTTNMEKKEILIRPKEKPGFGWYDLKEFNEKISAEIKEAYEIIKETNGGNKT
jgi:hypothetical protein